MTVISDIIFKHLIFFLVGVFQDLIITFYYQAISKQYAWRAGLLSTSITIINLFILYEVLSGLENQIMSIVLVYALGNGVGTMIVIKKDQIRKYFKKKFF